MKLYIIRDQAKALLGGVKCELRARVELTPEEKELVKKYKADKEVLFQSEVKIPFTGQPIKFDIKINDLITGETFKCKDIADILQTEDVVKEACMNFKNYLEVMRNFGGEEMIEYV